MSESYTVQSPKPTLSDLFAADAPARVAAFSHDLAGVYFDFSKTHLDAMQLQTFAIQAEAMDFDARRKALFAGDIANPTEGRAAEHSAERGEGAAESVAQAKACHARMRTLIDAIDAGAFGEIKHLLHLGIGGSALGPDLLIDALARQSGRYDVHIVSNIDGAALAEAFAQCDPQTTLIAIASKTFTTSETLLNARSALAWMSEGGVGDPIGRVVALTAAPQKALDWGVDETRILPFSESVGGRYSLWSSIGFPAALALGWPAFEELLEGAGGMDRHFRHMDFAQNICCIAAAVDQMYAQTYACQTRAVFAYDERLRLLPSYLQQLEMESNGKSVDLAGKAMTIATAPITWGGVGTDAQHAVFQLLHQGTHLIPVEFIAAIEPGHDLDDAHHTQLLGNCFAQGAALMAGKAHDDPARAYAGNRPSTTILLQDVSPRSLGMLIAFYEHRTFANAVLMGINPFDQFGVELGKEMAKAIDAGGVEFDASTSILLQKAGLA
jgi:glucose-6-phosphate isomerase